MAKRLPDNQEDREVYLRAHNAEQFVTAIEKTKQVADAVVMTIEGFASEPEVLYVALDYAYHSDIAVTMAPASERPSPRQ